MRISTYFKLNSDFLKDPEAFRQSIIHGMQAAITKYLKKSIVLKNRVVECGYDGEDFINDNVTVLVRFKGFKVPRIIKNSYVKRYNTSQIHR